MNQNRSMAIHRLLAEKGIAVQSYGTCTPIRLPGDTPDSPNSYDYGTAYTDIISDLLEKDKEHYTKTGLLEMLRRNASIKERPEYFFDASLQGISVVISCDPKCFDHIFERCPPRASNDGQSVMLGFDIKDTVEGADTQAEAVCKFVSVINEELRHGPLEYAVEAALVDYYDEHKASVPCAIINLNKE